MSEIASMIPEWVFNVIILISVPVVCYKVWKWSISGR